jgi:hypothetical protein
MHALRRKIQPLHLSAGEQKRAREAFTRFDGRCQCCGRLDPGFADWCLDHDHVTMTFRGIICVYCNSMLGMAHDSVKMLLDGVLYLEEKRKL